MNVNQIFKVFKYIMIYKDDEIIHPWMAMTLPQMRLALHNPPWREVLDFWFIPKEGEQISSLVRSRWFIQSGTEKQTKFDSEVTTKFSGLLSQAETGSLDWWAESPDGCLALIILLDQIARHIHRGHSDLIASNDVKAVKLSKSIILQKWDKQMRPVYVVFALMPLRHLPSKSTLDMAFKGAKEVLAATESELVVSEKFFRNTENSIKNFYKN